MTALNKVDVLDYLSSAVMVLNDGLRVCYLNSAAEALLGSSEARSTGMKASELVSHEDAELFADLHAVLTTGQSVTRRATQFRTRDGTEVVADLTISLEPASGHVIVELQPINRLVRINRDELARRSGG